MVINAPVTHFDLKRDLYHHIGSDAKWARVREACSSEDASNVEMMIDHMI